MKLIFIIYKKKYKIILNKNIKKIMKIIIYLS